MLNIGFSVLTACYLVALTGHSKPENCLSVLLFSVRLCVDSSYSLDSFCVSSLAYSRLTALLGPSQGLVLSCLVAAKAFDSRTAITVNELLVMANEAELSVFTKRTCYKVLNGFHQAYIADYVLRKKAKAWFLKGYMTFSKYAYSHDYVPALQPKTKKGLEI